MGLLQNINLGLSLLVFLNNLELICKKPFNLLPRLLPLSFFYCHLWKLKSYSTWNQQSFFNMVILVKKSLCIFLKVIIIIVIFPLINLLSIDWISLYLNKPVEAGLTNFVLLSPLKVSLNPGMIIFCLLKGLIAIL